MVAKRSSSRDAIIEVARRQFTQHGYKRTVIDEIVREVGIAKGTFYFHFKSKEELFFDVIETLLGSMWKTCYETLAKETTCVGKLKVAIRFGLEVMEQEPLYKRLVTGDLEYRLLHKLVERPQIRQDIDEAYDYIRTVLKEGIENGELRQDLDIIAIPFIIDALNFLQCYREIVTAGRISEEQFVDGIVDLALHGLVSRGPDCSADKSDESGDK